MAWLRSSMTRLREAPAPAVGIVVLTLLTSLVAASVPRLLTRAEDHLLRADVAAAPIDTRNLQLSQVGWLGAGAGDPLQVVDATGEQLRDQMASAVRAQIVRTQTLVDTPRFNVTNRQLDLTTVRLRVQPGAETRVRVVSGRLPGAATQRVAAPDGEAPMLRVEVALPVRSATILTATVGDTLLLSPDPTDPLAFGSAERIAIDVVGTYEVTDPTDPYWYGDTSLAGPRIRSLSSTVQAQDATALAAAGVYPALLQVARGGRAVDGPAAGLGSGFGLRYTWRSIIDPDRLEAAALPGLTAGLRRLETLFPRASARIEVGRTSLTSGLLGLLGLHDERWSAVQAALSVATLGAAVVAGAALVLAAMLVAARRRPSVVLWRSRGASRGQVLGSVAVEGLVLAAPAAVAGAILALTLVPGAGSATTSAAAAGSVAAIMTLLLVVAAAGRTEGPGPARTIEDDTGRGPGRRRLVAEGVIVGVALVGAFMLRDRGVRGSGVGGQPLGVDPFIAAVPALAGLAVGLLALRLFPLPTRLLARLVAARRDLVPVLALRRSTRRASSQTILTVLLATTAVGAFGSATLLHLDGAAAAVSWQETGAPWRLTMVDGTRLPGSFDPAGLPGVTGVAAAYQGPAAISGRGVQVRVLALDMGAYAALVGGTPADPQLPPALLLTAGGGGADGSATRPVPALVSAGIASGGPVVTGFEVGGALGTTFQLVLPGSRSSRNVSFRTVAVRDAFPSIPTGDAFVVLPRQAVLAAIPDLALPPTVAFLRAPDDAGPAMRAFLAKAPPGMVLAGQAERAAALRSSPLVETVADGVAVAALLAALYAALAVAIALGLAGSARANEMAHLRALGLPRREMLGLVLVEHGPTVSFAFLAGAALGLGLFVTLRDGLGLTAVIGSEAAVPLAVEPIHLAIILAVLVLIVATGVGLSSALERRADVASSLRAGLG